MTSMLKQNKRLQLRKGVQPRHYLIRAEVRLVRRGKIGKETIEDSQAGAPPPPQGCLSLRALFINRWRFQAPGFLGSEDPLGKG